MRILLIDPPFHRFMGFYRFYYPLGLASMAGVLKAAGHEVLIYDAEHAVDAKSQSWTEASRNYGAYPSALLDDSHDVWHELRAILAEFNPSIVGISMLSVKVPSALKVAAISKSFNRSIVVIVGADHPTLFPMIALKDPNIDIVVRGEGERTIAELAAALEDGREPSDVDGIVYRRDGRFRHTAPRELIRDLDSLPLPDIQSLVNVATYRPLDFGAIMGSRGCPYPCTFCGVSTIWSRKVRYRSTANVIAEIKWLHATYKTDFFSFRDASFTLNRPRVVDLCTRIMQCGFPMNWECTTRADLLDDEIWKYLRQSGCVNLRLGVESGSREILNTMKKNVDLDIVRSAARLLNRHGAYWSAYFLFGTPHETRETIRETMAFIEEIDPPFITIARYAPIPGTEMYRELERAGRVTPDIDWGLEGNQRPGSNHVLAMAGDEFEEIMQDIAASIEQRNRKKTAAMGMADPRFKE